mgnify:CR=1 FL=1
MNFLSKADNLEKINNSKNFKKLLKVPKFFYFKKKELIKNKKKIYNFVNKNNTIIRSSSSYEDLKEKTNAGYFESRTLKKNSSKLIIEKKMQEVCEKLNLKDSIIIQEYINPVDFSGVIFSADQVTNSPYIVIEYDKSGKTNYVTSGKKSNNFRTYIYKFNHTKNKKFSFIYKVIQKLEAFFNSNRVDIEFAVKDNIFYLFQIRALPNPLKKKQKNLDDILVNIKKKIDKLKKPKHDLYGNDTLFSNMSDWNPAEMIGDKPSPLAISMYKELITNFVWSKQRHEYGYKNCNSNVLMFDFLGSPYIDLRTDLNSFLPLKLDKNISKKAVNFYIKKIREKKHLHDKIEFEVIETCYTPDTNKKLRKFLNKSDSLEYSNLLKNITNNIIKNNLLEKDISKIQLFEIELNRIKVSNYASIEKIYKYISLIKDYGSLPFAGIARCAFISKKIIDYLLNKNLLSRHDYTNFFKTLNTINNKLSHDLNLLKKNIISKKTFLKEYGHIRPSMYDINSKNYKEAFKYYFDLKKINHSKNNKFKKKIFKVNNKEFIKLGYDFNITKFYKFCFKSIENRENSKNSLSKSINLIFEELKKLGIELNIKKNDLSFIDINIILNAHSKLKPSKFVKELNKSIIENKRNHKILNQLNLPDLINSSNDPYYFDSINLKENFITEKKINGEVCFLELNKNENLENKIILIKSADPGYDFIFSKNISGFITAYGGANSHMSIRALELNIPCAIGIGLDKFNKIKKSKKIILDCKNKKILF